MQRMIIFGATSAIALEVGRIYATRGAQLFLVARDANKLASVATDLQVRGAKVGTEVADLGDCSRHAELFDRGVAFLGGLDGILVAHGTLSDQSRCQSNPDLREQEIRTNFLSPLSLVEIAADKLEQQHSGTIAVITSVAGDRGRQSNYIYGAAKGALGIALSGVRNRVASNGVHVLTIKPGFVDTPMTAHIRKGALFASPAQIATGIVRAIERKRDVVYLPWFWCIIMLIIRTIPESIFKRLKL